MVAFLHKCEICHLGRVRGTTQRFRGGDLTISCHPRASYGKALYCKSEMAGYIAIAMAQHCIAERPGLGVDFNRDILNQWHVMI